MVESIAPSAQIVVLFGDGKVGAVFGSGFAKQGRSGYKPVSRKSRPAPEAFRGMRAVKLRYECRDGVVTCWINGAKRGQTKKLKGKTDGRVGLFVAGSTKLVVHRFDVAGTFDASEL